MITLVVSNMIFNGWLLMWAICYNGSPTRPKWAEMPLTVTIVMLILSILGEIILILKLLEVTSV